MFVDSLRNCFACPVSDWDSYRPSRKLIDDCENLHVSFDRLVHWSDDVNCYGFVWVVAWAAVLIPARSGLGVFRLLQARHA